MRVRVCVRVCRYVWWQLQHVLAAAAAVCVMLFS